MPVQSCLPVSPARTHVIFQFTGSGHQTLSLRPSFAACNAPGPIAGTPQLSNIQSVPPSRYGTGAPSPSTQTSGQWSASRRLQRPSTSTPDAEEKRATLWLIASNCSPPRTPAFTSAVSDSLVWLNVSPAACPDLDRPAYDLPSVPPDYRKGPAFY